MLNFLPRLTAYAAFVFTFAFFKDNQVLAGKELYGVVIDSKTNDPVQAAHVYVVAGEEEGLTGKTGQFKFTTWKSLPLTIHVSHDDYEKRDIIVSDASKEIRIELVKK